MSNKLSLERKYEIKNTIFTLAWCLLLIQVLIFNSTIPAPGFKVTFLCLLLLAFSAIFPFDYSLKEIIIVGICGIFTLILCYKLKLNSILWVYMFIVCSKGISLKPLFKKTLFIYIGFLIVCFALSQMGIITDAIRDNGGTHELKHSLGTVDANTTHSILLFIVAAVFCVYYKQLKYWHLIALFALNALVYSFTIARTSALIIYFVLIIAFVEKLIESHISQKTHNLLNALMIVCVDLVIVFFTIVPLIYNREMPSLLHNIFVKINDLITGRFVLANNYYANNGISLFGTYLPDMVNVAERTSYLDIGYCVLLIQYGLIFYFVYVLGHLALLIRFYRKQDFGMLLAITTILLHMSCENIATMIFFNIIYFYFRDFIFRKNKI
ncbi:MAG: hypothetical protein Q4B86_08285 [Eubacteriales bacterium]|nr:hypothetical protein [Eubacteriales bacterium]